MRIICLCGIKNSPGTAGSGGVWRSRGRSRSGSAGLGPSARPRAAPLARGEPGTPPSGHGQDPDPKARSQCREHFPGLKSLRPRPAQPPWGPAHLSWPRPSHLSRPRPAPPINPGGFAPAPFCVLDAHPEMRRDRRSERRTGGCSQRCAEPKAVRWGRDPGPGIRVRVLPVSAESPGRSRFSLGGRDAGPGAGGPGRVLGWDRYRDRCEREEPLRDGRWAGVPLELRARSPRRLAAAAGSRGCGEKKESFFHCTVESPLHGRQFSVNFSNLVLFSQAAAPPNLLKWESFSRAKQAKHLLLFSG
ncbi:cleavage and polyadenylation specificity factor subunit 6-like [Corvus kubaryi]|uniref:cleavage and polyadenylation specificity factor subunit 6-like n=1 Tax=Corvus kubaryi TaxID=68294 RepID=UPI001C051475|nr:cleavage and polyadenylation specificity factor subunit 6-like [Corvus kubaryi]